MTVRKVLVKGRGFNWKHAAEGLVLGVLEIAAVTAVIYTFGKVVPAYALTSLYVLAMLPIAVGWGFGAALLFAVASTVAFDLVISPPSLSTVTDADTTVILVISCVTAYVVSNLAARVRRRAREAEALAHEVQRFADEQAALRRVATLVARAAHPDEVFAAVTAEVSQLLAAEVTILERYESTNPSAAVVLGVCTRTGSAPAIPVGHRVELGGSSVAAEVYKTGRPARVNAYDPHRTPPAARAMGVRAAVGTPISVGGRVWGVMIIGSAHEKPLSPDTETRVAAFTELVATAIANAAARAALTASRTRIVATADNTRRRIERDLHDGTQQRLVSLALRLRAAQAAVPPQARELEEQLDSLAVEATSALDELREFARGIHPAILAEGGLSPALKTLARRSTVPVELDLHVQERLPEQIEVAAYFVVSEALTNAAKYARASVVRVEAATEEDEDHDQVLHVCVNDDGRGGADFSRGSGLVGLKDRVEALGGRIDLRSAPDVGTSVQVDLPLRHSDRRSSGP